MFTPVLSSASEGPSCLLHRDNSRQRLIIDARQANACHRRPPTTKLATPAGLLSLDMSPDTLQGNGFGEVSYGGSLMGSRPSAETGDLPGSGSLWAIGSQAQNSGSRPFRSWG